MVIVQHFPPHSISRLPEIVARAGKMPAVHAKHGQQMEAGTIYVAPPDQHVLIQRSGLEVTVGPRENRHLPAVYPLFRSAAAAYGSRVIGVILSGTLGDGSAGLNTIKLRGGVTIVQDPLDAAYSGMPQNAIEAVDVDHIVPLSELAELLTRLVSEPPQGPEDFTMSEDDIAENASDRLEYAGVEPRVPGDPSIFTCPDCRGTLWEIKEGGLLRYRCRVGHAFSTEGLVGAQAQEVEAALYAALRTLEEHLSLTDRMRRRALEHGHRLIVARLEESIEELHNRTSLLRKVLEHGRTWHDPGSTEHAQSVDGVQA